MYTKLLQKFVFVNLVMRRPLFFLFLFPFQTGESSKQRIPQAASHTTVSIGPQSLASMMMIQHLGNDNRRGRYGLESQRLFKTVSHTSS